MGCKHYGDVIVCSPTITNRKRGKQFCPNCKKKTIFVSFFAEWYGWDSTCLNCGDSWQDGEMLERPFMPKWREKSIEQAKKHWKATAPTSAPEGI